MNRAITMMPKIAAELPDVAEMKVIQTGDNTLAAPAHRRILRQTARNGTGDPSRLIFLIDGILGVQHVQ